MADTRGSNKGVIAGRLAEILEILCDQGYVTKQDVMERLGFQPLAAMRYLRALETSDLLEVDGEAVPGQTIRFVLGRRLRKLRRWLYV